MDTERRWRLPRAARFAARQRWLGAATTSITGAAPRVSTGDPGTAALAIEVSKLRVEVGELQRKRWDVHVNLRQDGSGLRMQKLLNGIR